MSRNDNDSPAGTSAVLPSGGAAVTRPTVDLSNFPEQLKLERIWCLWKYEWRDGKNTKVPYQNLAWRAASDRPETWCSLDVALANLANPNSTMDGIGCFVTVGRVWTDLDDCVKDGLIEPWAEETVRKLGSYAELSPSEKGVHIYSRGEMPDTAAKKKVNGCEMYCSARFFTVTGKQIPGTPCELRESDHLAEVRAAIAENRLRPYTIQVESGPQPRSGQRLIIKAPADFDKLFSGKIEYLSQRYPVTGDGEMPYDESRADQALANLLADKFNGNYTTIETVFSASKLGQREKWEREDYRQRTIGKAIEDYKKGLPPDVDPRDWRPLFHTWEETMNAPPITFAIEGFLQEAGITMLGGLSGHGKTFVALSIVKALMTGEKLFNYFPVPRMSDRIIYLIPESALSPFAARLKLFRLTDFVRDEKLFYSTLSVDEEISITDPRILEAAHGADVFLDTAVRFMEGDENNTAEQKVFAKDLFALLRAGARTVTGLHHAPKYFQKSDYVSLENVLRGSGDIGAMLATCWAIVQTNKETNELFIENTKPRDFKPCEPFIIQGRPFIDETGDFKMMSPPGLAGTLNANKARNGRKVGGRREHPQKSELMPRILEMHDMRYSFDAISLDLHNHGSTPEPISSKTLARWVREHKAAEELKERHGAPNKPGSKAKPPRGAKLLRATSRDAVTQTGEASN